MSRRNRRDELEAWVARRFRRAADDLSLAIGNLDELDFEARRAGTLLTPEVREEVEALMRDAVALRERVRALSPLPIADEE
jgi:hypothetical protein